MCSKAPIRVRQRKECADSFLESKAEVDYSYVLRSLLTLAVPALPLVVLLAMTTRRFRSRQAKQFKSEPNQK